MANFPTSLIDFQRRFPDEDACATWLFAARWPTGFRCPGCGAEKSWPHGGKRFTYECASCGKQTSVTAGTILHGSKLPLTVWFWASYLMSTHSNGKAYSAASGSINILYVTGLAARAIVKSELKAA